MIITYYPEEMLIQLRQDGEIGYQQYVERHSPMWKEVYHQFCKDNGYTAGEESALKFLDLMETLFNAAMESGEA